MDHSAIFRCWNEAAQHCFYPTVVYPFMHIQDKPMRRYLLISNRAMQTGALNLKELQFLNFAVARKFHDWNFIVGKLRRLKNIAVVIRNIISHH